MNSLQDRLEELRDAHDSYDDGGTGRPWPEMFPNDAAELAELELIAEYGGKVGELLSLYGAPELCEDDKFIVDVGYTSNTPVEQSFKDVLHARGFRESFTRSCRKDNA